MSHQAMPTTTAELQDAFQSFTSASGQLVQFYQALERRVERLSEQLEATRGEQAAQLAERERLTLRLENLLRTLPAGVVVLDGEGRVKECNPMADDLLGEALKGKVWRDVVGRAFAPRWDDGHDITLKTGRCVNIATQALAGEPGQILLIKDVTETRQLYQQLSHHQRLSDLGGMAASLAHQIRTPLASAVLYASQLSRGADDSEVRRRFSEKLISSLRHLESLVGDMLLYARGGSFDTVDVCLRDLLEELSRQLDDQVRAEGFELSVGGEAIDMFVHANRPALVSAMHNLATNAVQACGRGGALQIAAQRDGEDAVVISFTDNGPGIPEEVREKVFQPFFTTRARGTGLGLPVVRTVVEAHGGTITLDQAREQGTEFRIRLPLAGQADGAARAQNTETPRD